VEKFLLLGENISARCLSNEDLFVFEAQNAGKCIRLPLKHATDRAVRLA
jgi:hypothetical protein